MPSSTSLPCSGKNAWAEDFFHAGIYVFLAGALVSVFAALTGFLGLVQVLGEGAQARRTINTHAVAMITVTVLALTDIALRLDTYNTRDYPTTVTWVLSVVDALPRLHRQHLRRQPGVRVRLQRGDGRRPSSLARIRDRRLSRPALR